MDRLCTLKTFGSSESTTALHKAANFLSLSSAHEFGLRVPKPLQLSTIALLLRGHPHSFSLKSASALVEQISGVDDCTLLYYHILNVQQALAEIFFYFILNLSLLRELTVAKEGKIRRSSLGENNNFKL